MRASRIRSVEEKWMCLHARIQRTLVMTWPLLKLVKEQIRQASRGNFRLRSWENGLALTGQIFLDGVMSQSNKHAFWLDVDQALTAFEHQFWRRLVFWVSGPTGPVLLTVPRPIR